MASGECFHCHCNAAPHFARSRQKIMIGTRFIALSLLAVTAMLIDIQCAATIATKIEYVQRQGMSFYARGRPFVPVGVNNHYLLYGTSKEVTDVLDAALALGSTTVRTFLQPVIGDPRDPKT